MDPIPSLQTEPIGGVKRILESGESSSGGFYVGGIWIHPDILEQFESPEIEALFALAHSVSSAFDVQRSSNLWPAELLQDPRLLPGLARGNPFLLSPYSACFAGCQSPEYLLGAHVKIAEGASHLLELALKSDERFPLNHLYALSNLGIDLSLLTPSQQVHLSRLMFQEVDRAWVTIEFSAGDVFILAAPAESYGDSGSVIVQSTDLTVSQIIDIVVASTGLSIPNLLWECRIGRGACIESLPKESIDKIRTSAARLFGGDDLILSQTDIVIIDLLIASGRAAGPMTNLAKNYPVNAFIEKRRSVLYRNVIKAVIDEFLDPVSSFGEVFESKEEATNYALALLIAHEQAHAHEAITYSNSLEEMRVILASFIAVYDSGIFEEDSNSHNKLATIFMGYLLRYQQKYVEAIERDPKYKGSNTDYHNAVTMILNEFKKKNVGSNFGMMLNVSRALLQRIRDCVDNPTNGVALKDELYDPSFWNE
ncbi:hypothetical protein CO178_01565 [candidate division WWE3 bacterium CG_4_9_14_3_um_filter_34_6]|uniref:Uncharacterized protein n=1 Tax=candidate division WWE3 bacterium CG_4_9_14_3_um_filter_34_6 TaxID=1975079 RepID=A0A2M7X3R7_UNCKA|nr:MAG: hypothetical protein CO178_01565 [candidate division WWE3 bacterium CG_4_9_14_3_um_filter_34_6]